MNESLFLKQLERCFLQMVPCRKYYGEDALVKMKKRLAELYKVSPGSKTKGKSKTRTKAKKVVSEEEEEEAEAEAEAESVASDIQDEDELEDESFGDNIDDFVEEGEGADNSEEAKIKRQLYYEQNKTTRCVYLHFISTPNFPLSMQLNLSVS